MDRFFCFAIGILLAFSVVLTGHGCCSDCKEGKPCKSEQASNDSKKPFKCETGSNFTIYYDFVTDDSEEEVDLESDEFKEILTDMFMRCDLVEKKEDITFSKKAVIVKDKKGCPEKKCKIDLGFLDTYVPFIAPQWIPGPTDDYNPQDQYREKNPPITPKQCENNCGWFKAAADAACGYIKSNTVRAGALLTINGLYNRCLKCCERRYYMRNCVNSLKDELDYIRRTTA